MQSVLHANVRGSCHAHTTIQKLMKIANLLTLFMATLVVSGSLKVLIRNFLYGC